MKKIALFLQLAVLIYFVLFLILFFSFDIFGSTFNMDPLTPESMLKVFLFGFVLHLIAWAGVAMQRSKLEDKILKMQKEMNELKAKLYDFEHPKIAPSTKVSPSKTQDDTPANLPPRQNFTD
ncbi:hypothetical protein GCM10009119_32650 [Algoriphagus jejuensis]|uniref:Lipopolysaccharide assembly protein A domain-containing protein n=1 Tax=Algoriphagus jejuensis TaxID=419934 RepID=A0ABN1N343_9BACT